MKLISANWLSQVDRPRYLRAPVVEVGIWDLFELDATTPPDFVARSPHEDVYAARSPHADDSARSPHAGDSARLPRGRGADVCTPAEIDKRCGLSRRPMQEATQGLLMPGVTVFLNAVDRERTRHAALVLGAGRSSFTTANTANSPPRSQSWSNTNICRRSPSTHSAKENPSITAAKLIRNKEPLCGAFGSTESGNQHGAIPASPPAPGGDLVLSDRETFSMKRADRT